VAPIERDVQPLAPDGPVRTIVAHPGSGAGPASSTPQATVAAGAGGSDPAFGTLVHALLARAFESRTTDVAVLRVLAGQIASGLAGEVDRSALDRAVSMVLELLDHPDLKPPPGARARFEVAYSRRLPDGRVERGAIDLLIVGENWTRVIELKTGMPGAGHSDQLAAYVDAVREACPTHAVEGRIVYVTPGPEAG
jgi:hypothetical protein